MMLISFGARNYLSFKEGFEVSLELSPGCPPAISAGKGVSNVLCIIGPNASGKTNVIRALTFVSDFCCNSFSNKPEERLSVTSFGFSTEASSFFMEFNIGDVRYYYEVELTNTEVLSETLERKASRKIKVFSRKRQELEYCIKELQELKTMKLRKNVSVLSAAHQYEIRGLEEVYVFFSHIVSNIDPFAGEVKYNEQTANVFSISKTYYESSETLDFVREKLALFDTGINGVSIEKLKGPTDDDYFFPFFNHTTKQGDVTVPYYLESNGTRSLFSQLSIYKQVLDCGGVLLIDEFDNNLHPDILGKLVNLFLDPENNINNAQLVFCTHNTGVMDTLGKYRIVLVNKEENESFLYRIDELPGNIVRNDRSLETIYKTGKLGGTPNL